uniref:Ig-like domain-containing protein n=1 Tax=Amphilophus citrinellus TaxID=61819 RepID=A0A3Q0SRE4_AMPCI
MSHLMNIYWLILSFHVSFITHEDMITPEVGQTVTLTCRAPTGRTIQAVKWSRGDPGDQYVLLFQDGRFDPGKQHPSFKNRVDLQDRQMKDGDVSLILKDVMTDDDGAYECQVLVGEPRSWETISISYLSVHPAGEPIKSV